MASQPEVDMLHDYVQGFATYSMMTHASYQSRDIYQEMNNGVPTISWVPTAGLTISVAVMAAGIMQKLAQACIAAMGIPDLNTLILEIQSNIAARMDRAGYKVGGFVVAVEPGKWGVLRIDPITGKIVNGDGSPLG